MTEQTILSISSLAVTFTSVVLGFILQLENKKNKELERINSKLKSDFTKSIMAIQGYQLIEEDIAKEKGLEVSQYRRQIRQDKNEFFDSAFLTPSNINKLMGNSAE